ncbi:MAG TPA: hypothetical protein VL970_08395, partial [Candidatus Acidoferrales bacterium]|nr:hypothetical protein [Candidatus Acidoferrales bacterium]
KSQLAVFGLTREVEQAARFAKLIPCEDCSLPNCRYRRAAHKSSRACQAAPPPFGKVKSSMHF